VLRKHQLSIKSTSNKSIQRTDKLSFSAVSNKVKSQPLSSQPLGVQVREVTCDN